MITYVPLIKNDFEPLPDGTYKIWFYTIEINKSTPYIHYICLN